MKNSVKLLLLQFFVFLALPGFAIDRIALQDSLTIWANNRATVGAVRIIRIRTSGTRAQVYTDKTLATLSLSSIEVREVERLAARMIYPKGSGTVTIYSAGRELSSFITPRCTKRSATGITNLNGRHIALWASHGWYYNNQENRWGWQRAKLFTTVEDRFTSSITIPYLVPMLERAGATIYQPRQISDLQAIDSVSGMPEWMLGSRYWLEHTGVPDSIWRFTYYRALCEPKQRKTLEEQINYYIDDYACRGIWVNYLRQTGIPIDLSLAIHSDAGARMGDSIVGTLAIYTRRPESRALADYIQTQIVEDMKSSFTPLWNRRELRDAGYAETRFPQVPAVIIETLSHQNLNDMRFGLNPAARFTIARAIYKGVLRYFAGPSAIIAPLPVRDLHITPDYTLHWQPQLDSLEETAVPTSYIVYTATNDLWDNGTVVQTPTYSFTPQPGVQYRFRVEAVNQGGRSLLSDEATAYLAPNSQGLVLLVNAFDRVAAPEMFVDSLFAGILPGSLAVADGFDYPYIGDMYDFDRSHPWVSDDNAGWGACYADYQHRLTVGNTHDYPTLHGRTLARLGFSYVSASSLNFVDSTYDIVDIILGKQQYLPDRFESALADFIHAQTPILISGMYVGSAMATQRSKQLLHFSYQGDHATRIPQVGPYTLTMRPSETALACENPQGLAPACGATSLGHYLDTGMSFGIRYHNLIIFGFPLESITNFDDIYAKSIQYLSK